MALTPGQSDRIEAEVDSCRACGPARFELLFSGRGFEDASERFEVACCARCGLVRTAPALDAEQLARYYAVSYYGSYEAKFHPLIEGLTRLLNWARARSLAGNLITDGRRPIRVLDVGCGRGAFLKILHRWGYECYGTEMPEFRFPTAGEGIDLRHGRLEDIGFPDSFFSAVSVWHVLEHTTDPASTLREIGRILAPGGVAAIAAPNFGSLQRRLFNEHWFHLDLPRHRHHFTVPVLVRLLEGNGLRPIRMRTGSIEQDLFGFIQSLINVVMPTERPNRFYAMLKAAGRRSQSIAELAQLAGYLLLCGLLLPAGLAETGFSVLTGNGATAIIHARKGEQPGGRTLQGSRAG